MSSGHSHAASEHNAAQYDWLCRQAWFKMAMAHRPDIIADYDLPYLGGSSVGMERIYVDAHAYPKVVDARLLPGLIKHEHVEGVLLEHGWRYAIEPKAAHRVAIVAENREYAARGISPEEADRIYRPLIKGDELERLVCCPCDLHMEPYTEPPVDRRLLARLQLAQRRDPRREQMSA
jgi:hypothetical protein